MILDLQEAKCILRITLYIGDPSWCTQTAIFMLKPPFLVQIEILIVVLNVRNDLPTLRIVKRDFLV